MTTVLFSHDQCLDHVTPPGHPERVERLGGIGRALAKPEFDALDRRAAPMGEEKHVRLAHPLAHLDRIRTSEPVEGYAQIDADTSMAPGSFNAAMRTIGGNSAAVDAVLSGEASNAFVMTPPPGHHAEKAKPMGFCLFANVAIAALHAIEHHGLDRVAVLDFDVHHGNGTQDLLWDEERILFVSSQQFPLWPGTGAATETGAHDNVVNLPLRPGSGGSEMRDAYRGGAFPRLEAFEPQMMIISAGFDAHYDDPLAQLTWQAEDFRWLTHELCRIAATHCRRRVVSVLEGGYDLAALAASGRAHVEELIEAGK